MGLASMKARAWYLKKNQKTKQPLARVNFSLIGLALLALKVETTLSQCVSKKLLASFTADSHWKVWAY